MTDVLAPGFTIRPARLDDLDAVHALVVASDVVEFGESDFSLDRLRDDWAERDLERDILVATAPDGTVAGYAWVGDRRHVRIDVEIYVHPHHFGRGIGTTLVRRAEARAREHVPLAPADARVVVHNWINALNPDACALLEREGFAPVRYFWRMETELGEALPPAPVWPAGITVRPFVVGQDEHAAYATVEEAFADHWGHVPRTYEEWARHRFGASFDPSLWFLAFDGGEPAGAALCSVSEGIGWVDTFGVRRPWRRRGLGAALLRHAFAEFSRRGSRRVALGVDAASPTGATRLYEGAGMKVAQQYATYGKELRPGVELAEADEEK
ncbi:MAG: hypothetical protein AVDCRST_MAG59-4878 [uncultured Thermomicrobiales bacterium]|uniref:N-acetyltransferase domain-containing protein n=1 Tax=uncultured Thermomicrobiales bacterium TaxID=1645740 RepID=A0A6J4VLY9_9BACT|nr:MAG: hypothetical protein AVDCRST_MAG59-4878 [uncultured Thermomicrobiales bacterium]